MVVKPRLESEAALTVCGTQIRAATLVSVATGKERGPRLCYGSKERQFRGVGRRTVDNVLQTLQAASSDGGESGGAVSMASVAATFESLRSRTGVATFPAVPYEDGDVPDGGDSRDYQAMALAAAVLVDVLLAEPAIDAAAHFAAHGDYLVAAGGALLCVVKEFEASENDLFTPVIAQSQFRIDEGTITDTRHRRNYCATTNDGSGFGTGRGDHYVLWASGEWGVGGGRRHTKDERCPHFARILGARYRADVPARPA